MDAFETHIHTILRIIPWKELKERGFYQSLSPVNSFRKEYEIQYLHYTSYFKLFSAKNHLEKIQNNSLNDNESFILLTNHISNFIMDIFSVCDLLAKQIYCVYFNESILKQNLVPKPIYLHSLRKDSQFVSSSRRLPINNRRKYNRLYIRKIKKITNPKDKSWYNDLKYYRNCLTHGILSMVGRDINNRKIYLLKKGKFEKNFDFIIKNIPIHRHRQNARNNERLNKMFRRESVDNQCQNYYNKVVALAESVWQEILDFYLISPANSGVKLYLK